MDGQLERQAELESHPAESSDPVESAAGTAGPSGVFLSRLSKSPRLMLALGGTLVVGLIAVVAWQIQTPPEGVAQVKQAPRGQASGTARVRPIRKAQHMVRIATTGGRIEYISRDELARYFSTSTTDGA